MGRWHYSAALVAVVMTLPGGAQATHEVASAAALSIDRAIQQQGAWTVGISRNFDGCWARGTLRDGTTTWIGYGTGGKPYLAFTAPNWQSLQPGQDHKLTIRSQTQDWSASFVAIQVGNHKGLFSESLSETFINDILRGNLTVFFGQTAILQVGLAGTGQIINLTKACQQEWQQAQGGNPIDRPTPPPTTPPRGTQEAQPREEPKRGLSFGTGFFISTRGHVMTNHHVVDKCKEFGILPVGTAMADLVPATLLAVDKAHDLAVLRANNHTPEEIAVLNPRVRLGESVYAFGFPLPGQLASSGNFTIGNITATAGMGDDPSMLQISAPVHKGNSGGALLDVYGNAVGIIVSKLNKVENDVPQNINFAIKASIALNFVEANGISLPATPCSAPKDAATLADDAKQFTVRVMCQ